MSLQETFVFCIANTSFPGNLKGFTNTSLFQCNESIHLTLADLQISSRIAAFNTRKCKGNIMAAFPFTNHYLSKLSFPSPQSCCFINLHAWLKALKAFTGNSLPKKKKKKRHLGDISHRFKELALLLCKTHFEVFLFRSTPPRGPAPN